MGSRYINKVYFYYTYCSFVFILVTSLFLYFLTNTVGYGTDGDMYRMLSTWQNIRGYGVYEPSRFQGSPLAELLFGFLSESFGGSLVAVSNLIFCIATLLFLYNTIKSLDSKSRTFYFPFSLVLATNPYFLLLYINPMDYSVGIFLFSASFYYLLIRRNEYIFILLSGLASGSRIQYAPLSSLILLIYYLNSHKEISYSLANKFLNRWLLLFSICVLFYIPSFIDGKMTLANFGAAQLPSSQGILGRLARVFYKYFLLVGGFSFLAILYPLYNFSTKLSYSELSSEYKIVIFSGFACIIYDLVLFFYIPADPSYLLTSVYFLSLFLYILYVKKIYLITYSAICVLSSFYLLTPLNIDHKETGECGPIIASGAQLEFNIVKGTVAENISDYRRAQKCGTRHLETSPDSSISPLAIPPKETPSTSE